MITLKKSYIILALIILFGIVLRSWSIGKESLWLDEGISVKVARMGFGDIIQHCARDNHPPLYFLVLRLWIFVCGDSEAAVRALSSVFNIVSIFLIYRIGHLIFGQRAAYAAALIASVSPFFITHSQDAKMYTLAILLSGYSMYYYYLLLESGMTKYRKNYIISSVLLLYTSYSGLFTIIAQLGYLWYLSSKYRRGRLAGSLAWGKIMGMVIVGFVPWLWISSGQLGATSGSPVYWIPAPGLWEVMGPLIGYAGSIPLFFVFCPLIAIGMIRAAGASGEISAGDTALVDRVVLMSLWLCIPTAILFFIAQVPIMFFLTRYASVGVIPFYILAARGVNSLNLGRTGAAVLAIIAALSLGSSWYYYSQTTKGQWREVARYVEGQAQPDDLVVFHAGYMLENVYFYYGKRDDIVKVPFPSASSKIPVTMREKVLGVNERDIDDLRRVIRWHDRVWLVISHNHDYEARIPKLFKAEGYRIVQSKKFIDIYVVMYKRAAIS